MSVLSPSTACTITSPPLPPSPPFGPPNSMDFSRRNDTQPLPPSPERTYTLASSRNFMTARYAIADAEIRERARMISLRATLKQFSQKLAGREVSVGRGQGGPCLTDAAQ